MTQILDETKGLLETARFGLAAMREHPGHARQGFRTVVVFGRMVTFALQNLSSVAPGFDRWYASKQEQLKADRVLRHFSDLRTRIEKQATTPTGTSTKIHHFSTDDIGRFGPPPPGARGFFIGDREGGSGWEVENPDGSTTRHYVNMPRDIVDVQLHIDDIPPEVSQGRNAYEMCVYYLDVLEEVVREARARFGGARS